MADMTDMTDMSEVKLRKAARAIVLGPEDQILLVRFELKTGVFWATPGGGLEDGETHTEAIRRELAEEVGIYPGELVGPIWFRTHLFSLYGYDGQEEQYFLVRVEDLSIAPEMTAEELRGEGVTDSGWWSLDQLESSMERFAPLDLASRLASLIADGAPRQPIFLTVEGPAE